MVSNKTRKNTIDSSLTPLYAVAGLTDALTESVRHRLTELRQRPEELARFVSELQAQLRALPKTTRDRAAQLSEQATGYLNDAGTAYNDLAGRGKRRIEDAVGTAQSRVKQADPAFEAVQEAATQVRKRATGRTATETVTPKKAPAKKATTAKTTAKKAPAKTATAKKTGTAKKATTKKA